MDENNLTSVEKKYLDELRVELANVFNASKLIRFRNITVGDVHLSDVIVDVDVLSCVDIDDFDFDYVSADEFGCAHTEVTFTGKCLEGEASHILYKFIVNSDCFSYYKTLYLKNTKRFVQYFQFKNTHWYVAIVLPSSSSDCYFFLDEEEFEKRYILGNSPTIETHYSPMVVRGVMDADPEYFDYDVTPEQIDVPMFFSIQYHNYF